MNKQLLKAYIEEYKRKFDEVSRKEIYKWRAVKQFQDHWNSYDPDFAIMLLRATKLASNLLSSVNYFPLRMLLKNAEQYPYEISTLFDFLFDEEIPLYERIKFFQDEFNKINNRFFASKSSYQDPRAIIVYLVLRYPDRYFFYKFGMFKDFASTLDLPYKLKMGKIENIGQYNNLCELVRYELLLDQELLQLHNNRLDSSCYYDESLNILTQDFIYAVSEHLNQPQVNAINKSILLTNDVVSATTLITLPESVNFKGRVINFIQNNIDNKRTGDLGEQWVLRYEAKKLRGANLNQLIPKIKYTAKEEGDGTGYDIESFDSLGHTMYIEVKTTKGAKDTTFYITNTELKRSKAEKANYYLYRVYNYDESNDTADLLIVKGDLTNLCKAPTAYKVSLATE